MFNQQKYINEFNKINYKNIKIRIRKDDKIVLFCVKSQKNINKYIRGLIYQDAIKNRKYNFVDKDVIIDFELSKSMKNLCDLAEEADYMNDYESYMNIAYAIDTKAKNETNKHIIKESEWKKLLRRYKIW